MPEDVLGLLIRGWAVGSVPSDGGRGGEGAAGFALFSMRAPRDPTLGAALHHVYHEIAPGMEETSIVLSDLGRERADEAASGLAAASRFSEPELRRYPWTHRYDLDALVGQPPHPQRPSNDGPRRERARTVRRRRTGDRGLRRRAVEMNYQCTMC